MPISEPLPTWNAKMLTTGALEQPSTLATLSTLAMKTRSRPTSTTMDTPSWPSMPAMMTSPTMLQESLILAAVPASIMLFWLSDGELRMELTTGLSSRLSFKNIHNFSLKLLSISLRNSWGSSWGDSGFFKLKRGTCGDSTVCGALVSNFFAYLVYFIFVKYFNNKIGMFCQWHC